MTLTPPPPTLANGREQFHLSLKMMLLDAFVTVRDRQHTEFVKTYPESSFLDNSGHFFLFWCRTNLSWKPVYKVATLIQEVMPQQKPVSAATKPLGSVLLLLLEFHRCRVEAEPVEIVTQSLIKKLIVFTGLHGIVLKFWGVFLEF
jgi:hypothetical protein